MANLSTILSAKNVSATSSGGGPIVASGNPVFQTYADARAAITAGIDPSVKSFWTSGFYNPGDNGSSFYVDVGSVDLVDDAALFTYPVSALVVGEPAYIHDTINNRYFLMTPKNGEVWVEQFGATAPGWQTRGANLTAFLYKAQRYCIKTNFYQKQWGTSTIRVGPGFWYQATCFNIKGLPGLRVKGCGLSTYLQPEVGVSGISGTYQWSFDGNAVAGWTASHNYDWIVTVSNGTVRRGRLGVNGNVYELITAGISASSGVGPTGTGSDIVDGTAHWKWIRAMVPDEDFNTNDGGGSIVEDLQFYSFWNRATDEYGLACGIINTGHGCLTRNVTADNMSGHGIANIANGDPTFPFAAGNADGWKIENCSCYYNGWSGIRVGYSIGNAGHGIGIDVSSNGWFGVDDNTFLKATWADVQTAFDGRLDYGIKQHTGQVMYNGRYYTARIPIGGFEGAADYTGTPPDTSIWWCLDGGDGTWPADSNRPVWSNTGIYEPGGGLAGHDLNSRSVWVGVYVEQGTMPSQFGVNHTVIGFIGSGQPLVVPTQGAIFADGGWLGGKNGISISHTTPRPDGTSKNTFSQFGPTNQPLDAGIFRLSDWDANSWDWSAHSSDGLTHLDYALKNGSVTIWDLLGANTAKTLGGSQPLPGFLQFSRGVIIGDDTNGLLFDTGLAPPTSGYFAPGHRRFNKNYVPGGPSEWVCPAGGSPGTWYALVPSNTVANSFNFFNPSDNGGLTLSNSNHTALGTGGSFRSVRCATPWTSGKHYAEFTLDTLSVGSGFASCGLANSSETLTTYTGGDANATVLYGGGGGTNAVIQRNGVNLFTRSTPLAALDVIGIIFDATSQLLWYTVNGTLITGDPVAGTGGVTAPYSPAYLIFGTDNTASQVTANFGPTWAHTPPTGYS